MLINLVKVDDQVGQTGSAIKQWQSEIPRLDSLTSLRFLAALIVVLHHAQPGWVCGKFTLLMGQFGWLGVSFFFILSGFVLMWGFAPSISYREFVLRRLTRIYPLHLMTLVFSMLFFVRFGSALAGPAGNFWGTVSSFFLIHDWWPLKPGIRQAWNGVSWTLSCEFFFYLCAPWLFRRLIDMPIRRYWLFLLMWSAMLALGVLASLQQWGRVLDILEYLPVSRFVEFVFGAAAAVQLKQRRFSIPKLTALATLVIPLTLFCFLVPESYGMRTAPIMISLVIPGALLLIVAAALADIQGENSFLRRPVLVFLGEASFALYMTHAMLLTLMQYFVAKRLPSVRIDLVQAEFFRIAYTVCAILLSCFVYYLIERPIRRRLLQLI